MNNMLNLSVKVFFFFSVLLSMFYCFLFVVCVFYIIFVYLNVCSVLYGLGFFICILNDIFVGVFC